MNKDIEKIIEIAENLEWTVTEEENNEYLFSKYSPAGQDFNMEIECKNVDDLINSIYQRYENFDCSYETYIWLDNTGHGKNGAPYDMKDLYEDMEACEQMILDLYNELEGIINE